MSEPLVGEAMAGKGQDVSTGELDKLDDLVLKGGSDGRKKGVVGVAGEQIESSNRRSIIWVATQWRCPFDEEGAPGLDGANAHSFHNGRGRATRLRPRVVTKRPFLEGIRPRWFGQRSRATKQTTAQT